MGLAYSVFRGLIAIVFILGTAYLLSNNKKGIKWRIPLYGLGVNIVLINLILHTTPGQAIFLYAGRAVEKFVSFSFEGSEFVFGSIYMDNRLSFLFVGLIPLVFFGAFIALLYHYGIIQRIIKAISYFLIKVFKLSGVEAMGVCSNMLLGQSEGSIVIGPYIPKLTDSELFMIMSSGMACVSGTLLYAYATMGADLSYVIAASIISAPCSVIIAKMIFPETASKEEIIEAETKELKIYSGNALEALGQGAVNGAKIVANVVIMLLAFIGIIELLDFLVSVVSFGHFTFDSIIGYIFYPIAFLIGVPDADIHSFALLFGKKTCFNEFIAYGSLKSFTFTPKGFLMICFALTGFANLSSIAIQMGCYGAQYPPIRVKVAKLGLKALIAAVLANLLSSSLAGMFFI